MTIQDMDICLNVTSANVQKSQRDNKDDAKTKKADKAKFVKIYKNEKHVFGAKQRIKQKSLATIATSKFKTNQQSSQISSNLKNKESKKNTMKNMEFVKKGKDPDKSALCNESNELSTTTLFTFTKPTKDTNTKAVFARKKQNNQKTSLANIFSKNVVSAKEKDSEENITNQNNMLSSMKSVEENITINISTQKKQSDHKPSKKIFSQDPYSKKSKFDQSEGNNSKICGKQGYKISSLFGNNPEIPNIGQRFVKPINEEVFAGTKFNDLNIHPFSVSNLEQNMQISKMTTVQKKAIPVILSGKDVLIRSQTGSGKTLAYALPIIESLHKIRPKLIRSSGLKALIIVPTRELALQTYECFLKLIKPFTWIVPGYLVGGEKRKAEKARLRRGCNVLIATPGRLLDHIKHTEALRLNDVKYFVLDEADRMFDMGYEKDISGIVSALKIASCDVKETGYDAMSILRQNIKKQLINEKNSNEKIQNDDDNDDDDGNGNEQVKNKNNLHNFKDEISVADKDTSERKMYHSGTDSDSDSDNESFNKSWKNTKVPQSTKKSQKIKEISETEDTQKNIESDDADVFRRQTILLSATLTQAVEKLAGITMYKPIFVDAAKDNLESISSDTSELNEDLIVPQSVIQSYVVTPPKLRMVTLCAYIAGKCQSAGQHKILVFMGTQDMIDYHASIMSTVLSKPIDENDEDSDPLVDIEFFKLHGSMTQKERTEVFKTFKNSKSGVLLCTDVAARGLDMPKVDTVVQYTGPLSARDYVHRIGRTARAGSSGSAIIFLTPPEIEFVRMLESKRIRIKQDGMNSILDKLVGPLTKHNNVQAAATALQNEFETMILEDKKLHGIACKAYSSWVRFYASYPHDMRQIFNRKELHLGHYAKSFALRDPPQKIGSIGKIASEAKETKPIHNNRLSNERIDGAPLKRRCQDGSSSNDKPSGMLKKVRMLNVSEYGSGLEPTKKINKS